MAKKNQEFYLAIGLAILLMALAAWMDYLPYPESYFGYTILLGFIAAAMYYIFKKDLSEAVAVFATFMIGLFFGLEDFFFFLFGKGFPATMPNLDDHLILGTIRQLFGAEHVTPIILLTSLVIGGVIVYHLVKWLKKQPW